MSSTGEGGGGVVCWVGCFCKGCSVLCRGGVVMSSMCGVGGGVVCFVAVLVSGAVCCVGGRFDEQHAWVFVNGTVGDDGGVCCVV